MFIAESPVIQPPRRARASRIACERYASSATRVPAATRRARQRSLVSTCGRYIGSLRRLCGFGCRSRGSRYGPSVSISSRSAGIVAHDLAQVQAAALVADPAGDADVQAEIEVGARLVDSRREAMRDAADEARSDTRAGSPGIPRARRVDAGRPACAPELRARAAAGMTQLRRARRKVAKVVEPAFADRHDLRLLLRAWRAPAAADSSSSAA